MKDKQKDNSGSGGGHHLQLHELKTFNHLACFIILTVFELFGRLKLWRRRP